MSSSSSRNSSASARVPTPFCKVCRDAGRPESEYTSHFVKDQPGPNGKVVCPMLLNQACRICHKTGHTSSYCSEYKSRREERYIEREREREPRRDSYDRLREDTERREREIREHDDAYYREQNRRSKPWLQVAMKPSAAPERKQPYAHPHGPRVRLNLETTALCASKHAAASATPAPEIDVRKVKLNHATNWGDEDANEPFVCDPEQMFREFAKDVLVSNFTTRAECEFIAQCDDQSQMPFNCGE